MLPLRGVWWAVMLECHSAPADMQTREDCHRWSPRAQLRMLQFSIAQLELPAPWGTLQPSGSRSGLRETLSGPNGQVGRWGRQVHPLCPHCREQRSAVSYISFSLREEFLGHSHCCPIPWIPRDNKVDGARWAAGQMGAVGRGPSPMVCLSFLPLRLTPPLSHRSPQHGRINAENEPSSRNGAHGARPTGNQLPVCLSISLAICMHPPSLLFPSLSVCPRFIARKDKGRGHD